MSEQPTFRSIYCLDPTPCLLYDRISRRYVPRFTQPFPTQNQMSALQSLGYFSNPPSDRSNSCHSQGMMSNLITVIKH